MGDATLLSERKKIFEQKMAHMAHFEPKI